LYVRLNYSTTWANIHNRFLIDEDDDDDDDDDHDDDEKNYQSAFLFVNYLSYFT
jgi:hypothetical protein